MAVLNSVTPGFAAARALGAVVGDIFLAPAGPAGICHRYFVTPADHRKKGSAGRCYPWLPVLRRWPCCC
jgi:hypothetical protein